MYKHDTISNLLKSAVILEKEMKANISELRTKSVTISTGNRKIGRVLNVSTMPIMACHNCSECMHYCYDIKACIQYPQNVLYARMKNLVLAKYDRDFFFRAIDDKMNRKRTNKFFRWHVAGDILDMDYFERMVENAKNHSDFVIWTYTKCYDIVNEYVRTHGGSMAAAIPANFHIMFSKWDGMPMDNRYNFPVFACKLKDGNKDYIDFDNMFLCPGNCDICKTHNCGCIAGMNTYANEH